MLIGTIDGQIAMARGELAADIKSLEFARRWIGIVGRALPSWLSRRQAH
jgi:hypothetical protein